jgi:hypothetical protein
MENFNGKFTVAKPGIKPSSAVEAGITLNPTLNKFTVNGLATKKMGLVSGTGKKDEPKTPSNSISLVVLDESTDINNKFYICQGLTGKGAKLAAANNEQGEGKDLSFTYADIYPQIVLSVIKKDVTAIGVPKERLRAEGLAKRDTLLHKIYGKIESIGVHNVDDEERELFRIFDWMVTDHTPKKSGEKAEV